MIPEDSVQRKIVGWQSALIDLTRRNPLYALSPKARGLLVLSQPSDELYQWLVRRRKPLQFEAAKTDLDLFGQQKLNKPGHLSLADADFKTLNTLRLRSASALREQGINILFIAMGLLQWTEPTTKDILRSPLLLIPVALERLPGGDAFRLIRSEDEIEVNPTLRFRLGQGDIQITLPELPEDDDAIPSAYFAAVKSLLPQRPGWQLTDEAVLGRFSFLKMTMYRDLVAQEERARNHPIIAALAGDLTSLTRLPEVVLPAVDGLDQVTRGEQAYQVLDADPTQQRAILAARRGQSFVLQGPPGTGKTQTIANIITEGIASGKRVLFVSQKMAALDAVFKRLRDKGLADLCLEVHSHKANKKEVLEQLRRSLNARQYSVPLDDPQTQTLDATRDSLAEVVQALHAPRQPLGLSIYEANGIVARSADVPDLPFVFIAPEEVADQQYRQFEMLAERLSNYRSLFTDIGSNPWRGIRATRFTLDLQTMVRATLGDLRHQIEALAGEAHSLSILCRLEKPANLSETDHLLQVAEAAAQSPRPPLSWLTDDTLAELWEVAAQCRPRYKSYHDARQALLRSWTPDFLALPHAGLLACLGSQSETILRTPLGPEWAEHIAQSYPEVDGAARLVMEKIERLQRGLSGLAHLSGRTLALTQSAARHEARVAELACQDPRPQSSWFSPSALPDLQRRADEAASFHQGYLSGRDALNSTYTDRILALDLPLLRTRFVSDYDNLFRYCKPAYYRDRKAILLTLRPEVPSGGHDLARDLALAQEVRDKGEWIRAHEDELRRAFGTHYAGLDTDWAVLKGALRQTTLIVEACSGRVPVSLIQRVVNSGEELEALGDQAQAVQSQLRELDEATKPLALWMDLTHLSPVDLPLSQVPIGKLATCLRQIRLAAGDYYATRQQALACCLSATTPMPSVLWTTLSEARRLVEEEEELTAESASLRARYQSLYDGIQTDWEKVLNALEWAKRFRSFYPNGFVPNDLLTVVTEAAPPLLTEIGNLQTSLAQRRDALQSLTGRLADLFPPERLFMQNQPLVDAPLEAVTAWLQVRLDRLTDLERWIDFQNLRDECAEVGLLSFFETTIHRQLPQDQIVLAFRKQFHRLWLDGVTDNVPALRRFRGDEHMRLIARFCALDALQIVLAPNGVRALAQERKPNLISGIGEMGALKTQLNRQRPKAIRKLLADIPNLLFLLKPCLLMSPLSVSLFLESETIWFDLVIFDEASQVFTEDAVGAILRAKQVVIAGDAKQLPPTSFFQGFGDNGEEDEEEKDGAGDFESVLKAADAFADPGSPYFAEHPLNWHYRSHHESLIAFSKVHFYEHLIPYPSAHLPSAVRFEYVPTGVYYPGKGAKRNNPIEAIRVAEMVVQHVREYPEQSVGVITFNEPQQTTISAEIERRKLEAPELAPLLSEEGSEGFFVKNIENVQGDERDVIFLSLGFGHDPNGRLSMNFGPLNQDGGERRLNVAVTRARRRMTVVASILPGEIDLMRTGRLGPRLLKAYLQFAHTGSGGGEGVSANASYPQSAFEQAVEAALIQSGYAVRRQIGLFDYRVDLAIVDPEDPERFLLGLECDGPMYRDAPTARARERLRPQVLEALGWCLLRLWSSDWVRDPAREMIRVADAITRIKAAEDDTSVAESREWKQERIEVPSRPFDAEVNPQEQGIAEVPGEVAPVPQTLADRVGETKAAYIAPEVAPPALPPGVHFFQRWSGILPGGRATFYSEEKGDTNVRAAFLLNIVETEGPLSLEAATQRLAEAAGMARAGARVQEIVEDAADALCRREQIEQRGNFLWPRGMERAVPRQPGPQDAPRPFEFICLEEIGEAAIALLKVAYGMRRDELILETARLIGYRNTSVNIRERINEALSALELDNRIQVVGGQIRALELG